jgi:signal transduction histidine kinase
MLIEITTMERERSRIATDLHDDLGTVLSVVKFQVNSIDPSDHEDQLLIENASRQIDESIVKLREIANNLMPSTLILKGLFSSIKQFIWSVEHIGSANIHFETNCETNVADDLSIHIYRIVKEVIHNGLKHAQASDITINCKEEKNWLTIHYYDNGVGFDFKKTMALGTGVGLRSLQSRVEVVKGTMVAESKPGKGTAFLFSFPLTK